MMATATDAEPYVNNTTPTMGVLEIPAKLIHEAPHDPSKSLYVDYRGKPLKEYAQGAKAILFVNVASE